MDIEKLVNSKVYTFFDWVWRILVLNLLTLITSFGIITIFPSIVASYQSIRDFKEGRDENVFKVYFTNFGRYFKKTIIPGIVILVVMGVLIFGLIFYTDLLNAMMEQPEGTYTDSQYLIPNIGKFVVMFLLIIVGLISTQLPMIYSFFNFRFFDNFKFALYMTFKFFVQSMIEVLFWGASLVIFIFLNPAWYFIGLALPLYFIYSISRPIYWYLANSKDVVIHDKNEEKKEG